MFNYVNFHHLRKPKEICKRKEGRSGRATLDYNFSWCSNLNKLNADLVRVITTIYFNETRYRVKSPVDWTRQKPLDESNQLLVDSLFGIYQTYVGRSLVGKQLESAMWLVVQHAPLDMMERYLPVVATAVSQKQLDEVPLKMLIDRIYWLKYSYQIFSSQGAKIRVADDKIRNQIIMKYKLN